MVELDLDSWEAWREAVGAAALGWRRMEGLGKRRWVLHLLGGKVMRALHSEDQAQACWGRKFVSLV